MCMCATHRNGTHLCVCMRVGPCRLLGLQMRLEYYRVALERYKVGEGTCVETGTPRGSRPALVPLMGASLPSSPTALRDPLCIISFC
mgnify:CR=1 FL=1